MNQAISIIIPALNEAENIQRAIDSAGGHAHEIIVVDGGSKDETMARAEARGVRVMCCEKGRAGQMNRGAEAAGGDVLLFLHADTVLPDDYAERVQLALREPNTSAAAFRLGIDGRGFGLRLVEIISNLRSRYLGMPYGDQAIFLRKDVFHEIGGYPAQPFMEDFDLLRRLRKKGKIRIVSAGVRTSPRRWTRLGVIRTTLINQVIILAHYLGVSSATLAAWYERTFAGSRASS